MNANIIQNIQLESTLISTFKRLFNIMFSIQNLQYNSHFTYINWILAKFWNSTSFTFYATTIRFHDSVHTCIKPQNAYNIILEILYNQINAKEFRYN